MRRDRARNATDKRHVGFEKLNAKLGLDQLLHEEHVRRRDEALAAEAQMRSLIKQQKHREATAIALGKRIRRAEKVLATAKSQPIGPYEDAYFYGYERHMPLREGIDTYAVARNRMHLSDEELKAIIHHPELFPNPRLVYDLFTQRYRIDWDGKK